MPVIIRPATSLDASAILDIYAPIVRDTIISFELEPPTVTDMQQRITNTLLQFPWLVCEQEGATLGYVYASQHRSRSAYQWAANVSVYVHPDGHRKGIGRGLYTALFTLLKHQGFYTLYAGITLPNAASVRLHETLGFQSLGIYRQVGYKLGGWHDVGWWELPLQDRSATPTPPIAFDSLRQSEVLLEEAWAAGLALIHA